MEARCNGNSGSRTLVPGHDPDRIVSEACLHDEGVFPGVEVVAAPATDDLESKAAIERDGGGIARTHLEEGQGRAPGPALRESGDKEGAAHAAMAPLRMPGGGGGLFAQAVIGMLSPGSMMGELGASSRKRSSECFPPAA